jgi:hypothetical protein
LLLAGSSGFYDGSGTKIDDCHHMQLNDFPFYGLPNFPLSQ